MKKYLQGTTAIYCIFLLTSCTKLIYSHDDYINRFKSKQAVINTFGKPTENRESDSTTEWLYDFSHIPKTRIGSAPAVKKVSETQTATVADFSAYKKYMKFTFNKEDSVVNAAWQGVDFTSRKRDTTGTIFAVLIGVGLSVGIGALIMGSMDFSGSLSGVHW